MRNNLKIFAPFALAVLIGSLSFAFAQSGEVIGGKSKNGDRKEGRMPPPPGVRGDRGGLHPRMLEQLNLTDEQKQQIEAIQTTARDAGRENFDKVRAFDEQLRTMVEGGNFNEEQARTILNNKAAAMTEAEIVRLRADAQIFKILTAEQKAQFEQMKKDRPEPPQRGGRGGFRPEDRPMN